MELWGGVQVREKILGTVLMRIPKVLPALAEMRRVLKQSGQLVFCEHGAAPDEGVRRWQNRLNPIWKRVGGGCNLNGLFPN